LNRTVCGVIFNVRIGKYFGLKNSVFYIRTVLTENNRFLCIFSFGVFIVNEYFTTVKVKDLCSPPFINDYPYHSQMRHTLPGDNYTILSLQWHEEFQDFNTSHFVIWLFSEL
jgi:hypothetical protein